MLLVLHGGLHKTASTYFQNLLLLNRADLRVRRVYVEPDTLLPANHGTAWMALQDDFRHVEAHVRQAIRFGCESMILSSEDFEGLIFAPARAAALEAMVRAAGATEIEWHFCLRDPGEAFASMYAELSRHQYVDFLAMSVIALRDGKVRLDRPAKRLPRHWELCFDYARYLTPFAQQISGSLRLHDFQDRDPYPGHRMLEAVTGADFVPTLPGASARNSRPEDAEVGANLVAQLDQIAADAGLPDQVREAWLAHSSVSPEIQRACEATISRKFAPGMEALFAQWAVSRAA